jgi:transcriptional regulator with XRE-family HTH domain
MMEAMVIGIGDIQTVKRPSMPTAALNPQPDETKKKVVYQLSDDQKELRGIRVRLGMTKESFSTALKVKQCTLDSYEYGKTKGVPKQLMESARELESKRSEKISNSRELFENRTMSSILGEWAEKLHVPMDNSAALGRLLNTTPTTIRRWRENKVRPDIGKLSKLASRVEKGPIGAMKIAALTAIRKLRSDSGVTKGQIFVPEASVNTAIERIREVKETNAALGMLLIDFEACVAGCTKIGGDTAFYQMSAIHLHGFVRKFVNELGADGLDDEFEEDESA